MKVIATLIPIDLQIGSYSYEEKMKINFLGGWRSGSKNYFVNSDSRFTLKAYGIL